MFAQLRFFQGTKREKEMGPLVGRSFGEAAKCNNFSPSFFFSGQSPYVAQAGLKTMIFLSLPPESWDYRPVTAFFEVFCASTRTPFMLLGGFFDVLWQMYTLEFRDNFWRESSNGVSFYLPVVSL